MVIYIGDALHGVAPLVKYSYLQDDYDPPLIVSKTKLSNHSMRRRATSPTEPRLWSRRSAVMTPRHLRSVTESKSPRHSESFTLFVCPSSTLLLLPNPPSPLITTPLSRSSSGFPTSAITATPPDPEPVAELVPLRFAGAPLDFLHFRSDTAPSPSAHVSISSSMSNKSYKLGRSCDDRCNHRSISAWHVRGIMRLLRCGPHESALLLVRFEEKTWPFFFIFMGVGLGCPGTYRGIQAKNICTKG